MKRLLLILGLTAGMNAGVALAQQDTTPANEKMPGHDTMPADQHANMPRSEHAKHKMKMHSDADKNQPPKADDQKHEGHEQP